MLPVSCFPDNVDCGYPGTLPLFMPYVYVCVYFQYMHPLFNHFLQVCRRQCMHVSRSFTEMEMSSFWRNMMMLSHGSTFCITDPLWGESTGEWWIPFSKTNTIRLWCFLLCWPEQFVEQTVKLLVICDVVSLTWFTWFLCNDFHLWLHQKLQSVTQFSSKWWLFLLSHFSLRKVLIQVHRNSIMSHSMYSFIEIANRC